MAGAGKKTFTAGEVLTASDVNTYLMEQSIMVFGGTAARSSAIPTPSEGMVSYRTDVNGIDYYNGSAWVGANGLDLLNTTTFTTQSSVSINNIFSTNYDNYVILHNISASTNADLSFYYRASGVNTTTNYNQGNFQFNFSGSISSYGSGSTIYQLLGPVGTLAGGGSVTIYKPAYSGYKYQSFNLISSLSAYWGQGLNSSSTVFDGFSIAPTSGTITGTIRVYGLRNS